MASPIETSPSVADFRAIAFEGINNKPAELEPLQKEVLEKIQSNGVTNLSNIKDALGIMYFFEGDRRRKDNANYAASHQLEVMNILADAQITDEEVYIIAALHDTPENTVPTKNPNEKYGSVQAETLGEYFNSERIGKSIESLSLVKTMNDAKRNDETHLKLFRSLLEDPAVILVKLADRLHNMRTIGALSHDKQKEKADETMDIYVKLALKLGMNVWAYELAARSLAILYRDKETNSDVMLQTLADYYNAKFPLQSVQDIRASILTASYLEELSDSKYRVFASSVPRLVNDFVLDDSQPKDIEPLRLLYDHYVRNKRHIDPSSDTYYLGFEIEIPGESESAEFLSNAHRLLLELQQIFVDTYGWSLTKEQIYEALKIAKNGVIELPIHFINNKTIVFQVKSEATMISSKIGLDVLYKRVKGEDQAIAGQKLAKLQKTLQRIDIGMKGAEKATSKKRYTKDIVHEFLENLDADLISVFSPTGEEFVFAKGAKIIDYAYAAGTNLGNQAVTADLVYGENSRDNGLSINTELKDGAEVILTLSQVEEINAEFIARLEMTKSTYTKEMIAERIKEQMDNEKNVLKMLEVDEGEINEQDTPATYWVRERGLYFIEQALTGMSGTLPDLPFFGVRYANPFGRDTQIKVNQQFVRFVEEVGLNRIEPQGRREDYFSKRINQISNEQAEFYVAEIEVPDEPGTAGGILNLLGDEDINVIVGKVVPNVHDLSRKRISRILVVIPPGVKRKFQTQVAPNVEKRKGTVVMEPMKLKDYKPTSSWQAVYQNFHR